jgi:hypothetical protein
MKTPDGIALELPGVKVTITKNGKRFPDNYQS